MSAVIHTLDRMLTPEEEALLAFETSHPTRGALKSDLVREHLGIGGVTYYRLLHQLVRRQDAVAAWPMTCARVQRVERARGERRQQRSHLRRAG
jgi:hypothetical protein